MNLRKRRKENEGKENEGDMLMQKIGEMNFVLHFSAKPCATTKEPLPN